MVGPIPRNAMPIFVSSQKTRPAAVLGAAAPAKALPWVHSRGLVYPLIVP